MSDPVFLGAVDARAGDEIVLDGPEGRHAATVRRMRADETFSVTDGAGGLLHCRVIAVRGDTLSATVLSVERLAPPSPRLVVVQAVPKGDRGELAVATLTEVGVDEIVPWAAARCVTVWKADRAVRGKARWAATARESAKQSRRAHHPVVADVATTADVVARVAAADLALVLHEEAAAALRDVPIPARGMVLIVVGPEGGLTEDEVAAFAAAGAVVTRLGPEVLRTSTAGTVAAAVVASRTARWDGPATPTPS